MVRIMPPGTVANSVLRPILTPTSSSLWAFVFVILSLLSTCLHTSAQSDDATIAALKRGESTYFTAKMQNLSDELHLNQSQQTRLRPIAEQETAYIEQIRLNPVLSLEDKFKRLQTIVKNSDNQMKHFLSAQQWQKLQSLRKDQKANLENYVETR
jgi:Spy/CpxP family protein refolding chaperone